MLWPPAASGTSAAPSWTHDAKNPRLLFTLCLIPGHQAPLEPRTNREPRDEFVTDEPLTARVDSTPPTIYRDISQPVGQAKLATPLSQVNWHPPANPARTDPNACHTMLRRTWKFE
ncbi:hypothetical protein [Paraburkholderia bonniea]|uniref:hypothetical protein n=1 Tax=Paraburkholderia bonniea TaxID=2152891 RepID=UPI001290F03B|nr:hypothetical protein [Paraburkholderia bonniea]